MGMRLRSATPGTILCLAATVLLALVSFNTPLLKSFYFLEATFSSGTYDGEIKFGTMGYCLTSSSNTTCVGPTIGYSIDLNTILDVTEFNIPTTIAKYLTYTLVLHIVALGFGGLATIFGLLSHFSTLSVLCFPTCFAALTSTFALIALVFDLVIWYIAKARIDDVSGASASIGAAVWMTLAAWLIAGFAGCAYGIGRCCIGKRSTREPGDDRYKNGYYPPPQQDDMRLQAIRDEQRRQKEQGLPTFQELERTPLTDDNGDDKYLYEEPVVGASGVAAGAAVGTVAAGGLRRDGSVLQGVGVGYGRRNNSGAPVNQLGYDNGYPQQAYGYSNVRRPSLESSLGPGTAGVGAGGAGIDAVTRGYGGYGDQSLGQNYYADPYNQQQQYGDHYQSQNQFDQPTYPPQAASAMPGINPASQALGPHDYYAAGPTSSEGYHDPGPRVSQATDPYGGYDGYDDGLGAIGRAATSPSHEREYTGQTFGYSDGGYSGASGGSGGPQIHVPTPQHLVNPTQANILHSPISPVSDVNYGQHTEVLRGQGAYGYNGGHDDSAGARPPSYGAVAGAYQPPPEKSGR